MLNCSDDLWRDSTPDVEERIPDGKSERWMTESFLLRSAFSFGCLFVTSRQLATPPPPLPPFFFFFFKVRSSIMTITAVSFSFIFFSKEKWADFVVLLSPLVLFSVNLNTYVLQSYKCINDIFIVTPPHPFLVLWLYVNVSQIETWRDDQNALPTGFYTEETQPATAKTYFSFWSGVKKKKN